MLECQMSHDSVIARAIQFIRTNGCVQCATVAMNSTKRELRCMRTSCGAQLERNNAKGFQ